jgi:hypothetical protein
MPRFLTLMLVAAVTHTGEAQAVLSARDSSALVEVIAADLRASYRAVADGMFALDTTNASLGPLTIRVIATLRARDSMATTPATRTTPRVRMSNVIITSSTAAVTVTVNRCSLEPREWVSGTSATHRYIRVGERWAPEPRRSVTVGDGVRCPY